MYLPAVEEDSSQDFYQKDQKLEQQNQVSCPRDLCDLGFQVQIH